MFEKRCYQSLAVVISFAGSLLAPFYLSAETYQTNEQFLHSNLSPNAANVINAETLWLTKSVSETAEKILGHSVKKYTQKYWRDNAKQDSTKNGSAKTLWILDEIGKEEPITAGFVVSNGKIISATVLAYRESRGNEIRYPGFLKQYQGVGLQADNQLNQNIDGISGATLSVRAMAKMARLALYYDGLLRSEH